MIRIVHTADIHFGVENYGRIDPQTGIHTRLLDFKAALDTCIDATIKEDVDLFVFAGDAYKTAYPTPTQQKLLMGCLLRLHAVKIPVVIIVGNHDHPLSFGKANSLDVFGSLPVDGFYVFSKPEAITVPTKSGDVQVVGVPWPTRHNVVASEKHRFKETSEITAYLSQQVGSMITHLADQLDPALPAILVGHLTVSTGVFSGSEKCAVFGSDPIFLPSQLAIPPFDYVALGHLHRHQNLNENGYPPVVYAGSIERVDFGERKEPKGYCVVTINTKTEDGEVKKSCSYEFVELPVRPMIQVDVTLTVGSDHTEQILSAIAKRDIEGALLKVVYHVPEGHHDRVDVLAVQRACAAAHYLVGIFPVHKPQKHERRATLKTTMEFKDVLATYFEAKQIPDKDRKRLDLKARKIFEVVRENELQRGDHEEAQ